MLNIKSIEILELGLNSICNLSCPLCTRNKIIFKNKEDHPKYKATNIDFHSMLKFIDELTNLKEIKIVGAVGEPTLYPFFLELLDYCNVNKIKIWLSTNGSTRDKEWWYQVGRLITEDSIINFDIDHTEQLKQKTYRRGSDLNKIRENILSVQQAMKDHNKNIILRGQRIDFDWNKDDKKQFIEYCNTLQIEPYDIPCYDYDQKDFNEDVSFYTHPKEIEYKLFRKSSEVKIKYNDIICASKKDKLIYLNYMGEVIPCCYINDEILKDKHRYINIYDNSVGEIIANYNLIINQNVDLKFNVFGNICHKFCNKFSRNLCKKYGLDP